MSCLTLFWQLYRRNRFLSAALVEEKKLGLIRSNETVKTCAEAYSRGPNPSLEDLLSATEKDFELRRSKRK